MTETMNEQPACHAWMSSEEETGRFCRHCGATEASRARRSIPCPGPVSILARLGMVSPDDALVLHPRLAKSLVGYIERFSSSHLSMPSRISCGLVPRASLEQKAEARAIVDQFFVEVRNFSKLVPGTLQNDPCAALSPDYGARADATSLSRRILLVSSSMRFILAAAPLKATILDGLQPKPRVGAKSKGMAALGELIRAYGALRMDVEGSRPLKIVAS